MCPARPCARIARPLRDGGPPPVPGSCRCRSGVEHGPLGRGYREIGSTAARQGCQARSCRQRAVEQAGGLVSSGEGVCEPGRQRRGHISPEQQPPAHPALPQPGRPQRPGPQLGHGRGVRACSAASGHMTQRSTRPRSANRWAQPGHKAGTGWPQSKTPTCWPAFPNSISCCYCSRILGCGGKI